MAQPIGNMVVKVGLDDTGFNRGIEGLKGRCVWPIQK